MFLLIDNIFGTKRCVGPQGYPNPDGYTTQQNKFLVRGRIKLLCPVSSGRWRFGSPIWVGPRTGCFARSGLPVQGAQRSDFIRSAGDFHVIGSWPILFQISTQKHSNWEALIICGKHMSEPSRQSQLVVNLSGMCKVRQYLTIYLKSGKLYPKSGYFHPNGNHLCQ
jgi:hypothetical protein